MKYEPLVTIAIASYNNLEYVDRCILSVLNQTYDKLDVILVDDGSTDGSFDYIFGKYGDRIRVIKKENGGLSSVRERALIEAVGEYISFIDADDYIAPTYVENMLSAMKTSGADLCVCGTFFMDMQGKCLFEESEDFSFNLATPIHRINQQDLLDNYTTLCAEYKCSDSWNKLYLVDFIKQSNVHFCTPKGFNGSDSSFNKRLLLHSPAVCTITTKEYYHVLYNSSAVHRKNKQLQSAMEHLYSQIIDECNKTEQRWLIDTHVTSMYMASLRDSFQDLSFEKSGNIKETIISIRKGLIQHNKYIGQMKMKIQPQSCFSTSINMFAWCLLCGNPFLLLLHILLRARLLFFYRKLKSVF